MTTSGAINDGKSASWQLSFFVFQGTYCSYIKDIVAPCNKPVGEASSYHFVEKGIDQDLNEPYWYTDVRRIVTMPWHG